MQLNRSAVVVPAVLAAVCGAAFGQSGSVMSHDEVRALVAEATSDAQSRTSLLSGADGGHDGDFFLASEGFRLEVGGQMQFRYIANFRDEDDSDDFDTGFQARRTKVWFEGTVHENFGYKVVGGFDRDGGEFSLEDAFVTYEFDNGFELMGGQFKLPVLWEESTSSSRQLAVERSIMNEVFNQDRSQGVQGTYTAEQWRVQAAFSDGIASDNTDFNSAGEADYAFTGRFDFIFGDDADWRRFRDFTSERGQGFAGRVGAAAHYQQMTLGKGSQTGDPADIDVTSLLYTFDAQLEGDGWNAFGAFVGNWAEASSAAGDDDFHDFGVVLQGGYRVTERTEIFGRWDAIFADDDRNLDEDTFNFITAGVNHYLAGHAVKATADIVYALEETDDLVGGFNGFPNDGAGMLGSMEDSEIALRLQFQLLF